MKKSIFLPIIALLLAISGPALASKNPGKSAQGCVSDSGERLTNNCNAPIFILWCGDLKYSSKACGDGPKGGFYTQSANLEPGASKEIKVKDGGRYQWAACYGGISFGNDGEYTDSPNGGYRCLAR